MPTATDLTYDVVLKKTYYSASGQRWGPDELLFSFITKPTLEQLYALFDEVVYEGGPRLALDDIKVVRTITTVEEVEI